jgi:hypothetical protein
MSEPNGRFRWETDSGEPVTVGDLTVTPQSQALTIRWPGGGWSWNRPVALVVERDQRSERIPIVDVTRAAQLGVLVFGLVVGLLTLGLRRK